MPRFYVPDPLAAGLLIDLPEAVAHHLHVLRLQIGAELILFNGDGAEYLAHLASVEKRRASASIKVQIAREAELPYAITLAQAMPEGSKMDWIIEKAVELGAAAIVPLAARRSVVRLAGERAQKRRTHWQAVVVSASEQCGRNRLAQVGQLDEFAQWITQQDMHKRVLLSPRGAQSLASWAAHQPPQALTLMIGPEGGFTEEEEAAAQAHGALVLSIGPRVLRTETAGLAALAALNALWGGF